MNAEQDTRFAAIIKPAQRLIEEFQIPPRTKNCDHENFRCPCLECDYSFNRANMMVSKLAAHIAEKHLLIPRAVLESANETATVDLLDKLTKKLRRIIQLVLERKEDAITKQITVIEIIFQDYKKAQRAQLVETGHVEVSVEGEDVASSGDETAGDADELQVVEDADCRDDWLLLEQGLQYVLTALAARRRDGPPVDPPQQKIETYLNKFDLLRKSVTDLVSSAFDSHKGKDLFTGWSQHDYDEMLNGEELPHPAFAFRSEKESGKRYYETDHIWEIQVMAIAIRESQRFGPEYHLSLSHLITVFDAVNQVQNLNGTTWKLNKYKGNVMKDFKQYYQVTQSAAFNTIESIIAGNNTYRRIFLTKLPLADEDAATTAASTAGPRILDNLKSSMRQVLVNHFYVSFFNDTEDKALKMLYAVLCSMFDAMFPTTLDT